MPAALLPQIAMATGFVLILMGLYGALTHRNILRMIVGFTIASTGVNVVLVSVGYLPGRAAPIMDEAVPVADAAARIIDPVPQALVLTAIVIGLGVTALMLAYAYRLFRTRHSLDISNFTELEMVSAIFIIAVGLGTAFLLGLVKSDQKAFAFTLTVAALAFMSWVAYDWTLALARGTAEPTTIMTAGTRPPFAINLFIGEAEAWLLTVINVTGLLAAFYMRAALCRLGRGAMAVLLIMVMALSGLVLTRDVFNLFVFFELIVIATGGLVLLSDDARAVAAGFKYLVVSQIISILLLVGIIFTYHAVGSLNIDDIVAQPLAFRGASLAMFLLLMALVLELKPFPANGWALDIYESAHPGFSALFSAASGTAALFAADKLAAVAGAGWLPMLTGIGLLSFLASNVLALAQTNDRRLLGYSSIGQIGLVLAIVGQRDILGDAYLQVAGGVLITHAVAKAGLYWISGLVPGRALADWAILRVNPVLIFAFASFVAMLVGLPPFPSFYAKWDLVHALAAADRFWILGAILLGALIEAGYMFRFFGYAIKRAAPDRFPGFATDKVGVVVAALAAGWALGFVWGGASANPNLLTLAPLLFALAFLVLEPLPVWFKNLLAIAGLVGWFWLRMSHYDPMQMIFAVVMLIGGAIILLASFYEHGRRLGFYVPTMLMYGGLALLIEARTSFEFFAAWEVLTIGSYFLILRGRMGEPHALSYILFSLGGAFLILAGFAVASTGVQPFDIKTGLAAIAEAAVPSAPWVFALLAVGFMTKTASIGLHVWLPGAHAEAETDVSPMVSGILLKAGLFGLFLLVMTMGRQVLFGIDLTHVLVWIGALSAFLGAVAAIFQEDAKRLLAYSSISQMGYAMFGLALMNHVGWLLAMMFVINHYVYKSMLFLAVGGVYKRTGTKLMYKMGGLITVMPFTFVSVLVGIIAMSGVPPLSGFGGRWLFYNAIMASDLRLPMVLIFMSGPIGFLYLFRLIHTIFLGQPKPEYRKLRDAPFWLLVPQMLSVAFLIAFAVLPGLALQRVDGYIGTFFGDTPLVWSGRAITSAYGNWNPVAIMTVIGVVFVTVLGLLILKNHDAQKVKQFNIVFSAERPFKPHTTHFAWNFFAPYRKALGFLEAPLVTQFWGAVSDTFHATADFTRRLYSGNGQTYAVQVVFFVVAVYIIAAGGVSLTFEWIQIPYALLTLFIILNYGMFMTAIMQKLGARVGGRYGIPVWQNYIDLVKNWSLRTKITHGVMFYLGPVFRLTGGLGLILFVPTIYGSVMHQNFSYSGDLILALYFIFFGTLGMALGAGESGHPHSAIGVSRGLAQVTAAELPMALAVFSISLQYQTLNITEIVAAQQGGLFNWTLFTNPLAVIAAMFGFVGTMMRSPFDVVLAPQEIPIGPPTEYHSAYLALMQTNRVIFPIAKTIIYMNLFFGGAGSWGAFAVKVFALYFVTVLIGVVMPRFRVEQSIRFFLKWGLPVGILAIMAV